MASLSNTNTSAQDVNTSNAGFVRIPRAILASPYFDDPRLLKAWMTINIYMRFRYTVYDKIPLEPGDALFTKDELARHFGVNKRGVRTILNRMQRDGYIRWINIGNRYTLISMIDPMMETFNETEPELEFTDLKNFRDEVKAVRERSDSEEMLDAINCENDEEQGEVIGKSSGGRAYQRALYDTCQDEEREMTKIDIVEVEDMPVKCNKAEGAVSQQVSKNDKYRDTDYLYSMRDKFRADSKNNKKVFGEYRNVYLTDEEVALLEQNVSGCYPSYINKLSFQLYENPSLQYDSHYEAILSRYNKDKAQGMLESHIRKAIPVPPMSDKCNHAFFDKIVSDLLPPLELDV